MPMRAHIIWTAAISGHVSNAVQRSVVPSCAPATEYVAMPEGSSSAAPVMIPGPSDLSSDLNQRDGTNEFTKELGALSAAQNANPDRIITPVLPLPVHKSAVDEPATAFSMPLRT